MLFIVSSTLVKPEFYNINHSYLLIMLIDIIIDCIYFYKDHYNVACRKIYISLYKVIIIREVTWLRYSRFS